jgi:hypothetical protein
MSRNERERQRDIDRNRSHEGSHMADEQPQFTPDVVAYPAWRWTCPQCRTENYLHESVEGKKLYITLDEPCASCFMCSHPVELIQFNDADDCDPEFKVENHEHDYDAVALDEDEDDEDDEDDDDSEVYWDDEDDEDDSDIEWHDDDDDDDEDDSDIDWDDDFDDEDEFDELDDEPEH